MSSLISDEYLKQLELLRSEQYKPRWGNGGQRHAALVRQLAGEYGVKTLLDYGCGLGMLMAELKKQGFREQMTGYDPGIPERSALPEPADMVVSTDVLEHIEPDLLDNVLKHIRELTLKVAYLHIHTGPANTKLPDGRNAHLIQKPSQWWQDKLREYFSDVQGVNASTGARKGGQIFGDYRPTFVCLP